MRWPNTDDNFTNYAITTRAHDYARNMFPRILRVVITYGGIWRYRCFG